MLPRYCYRQSAPVEHLPRDGVPSSSYQEHSISVEIFVKASEPESEAYQLNRQDKRDHQYDLPGLQTKFQALKRIELTLKIVLDCVYEAISIEVFHQFLQFSLELKLLNFVCNLYYHFVLCYLLSCETTEISQVSLVAFVRSIVRM